MTAKTVKGGRGRLVGRDSRVLSGELLSRRALEPDRSEQLTLSPWGSYGGDVTANTGYTQDLRLTILPELRDEFKPAYGRIRFTTALSGRGWFVAAAIYRFSFRDSGSPATFSKVPGTDALFPAEATGVQTIPLARQNSNIETMLTPGVQYFLGAFVSDSSIGLVSDANTGRRLFPVTAAEMTASRILPKSVKVTQTTKHYEKYAPWIVYLSRVGAEIL